MTRKHFERLTEIREEGADLLDKPFMSGVQNSVVEKYSEPAHFVYELIQNADDAGATYARFDLSHDRVIFAHNGKRHFTVSDPDTEGEDKEAGRLGDINSITAIALSSKDDKLTIGKFGVGFKAVFSYTETPHIYGPTLNFRIERFLVPRLLDEDHPDRRKGETLFEFPFDKPDVSPNVAVEEIAERLGSLVLPTLFLNSLTSIEFCTPTFLGSYAMRTLEEHDYEWCHRDLVARLVSSEVRRGKDTETERLWLMSSAVEGGHTCSVGFFVDDKGRLSPKDLPAFCFFPTKVSTGLNFIVHTPFLLTDSREGIKMRSEHNTRMIEVLGNIAAGSLEVLCDIGVKSGHRIIDDNMFDVVPYPQYRYGRIQIRSAFSASMISFAPIEEAMANQIKTGTVLPGVGRYRSALESCFVEGTELADLLDDDLLQELYQTDKVGQVLCSLSMTRADKLAQFLRSIGVRFLSGEKLLEKIDETFTARRDHVWLGRLHDYIASYKGRVQQAKTVPVFLDDQGQPCAAFDKRGVERLFLPSEASEGCHTIARESMSQGGTRRLVKVLDLKEPNRRDWVLSHCLPRLAGDGGPRDEATFLSVYRYYKDEGESATFLRKIADYEFLACRVGGVAQPTGARARDLYLPTEALRRYFTPKLDTPFVDLEYYQSLVPDEDALETFLRGLGVASSPRLIERKPDWRELYELDFNWGYSTPGQPESWVQRELDGLSEGIAHAAQEQDWNYSRTLWDTLATFCANGCGGRPLSQVLTGTHHFFYYSSGSEQYEPKVLSDLRGVKWVCDKDGIAVAPGGLSTDVLSERYDIRSAGGRALADFLDIHEPVVVPLSKEEQTVAELDAMAHKFGYEGIDAFCQDPTLRAKLEAFMMSCSGTGDGRYPSGLPPLGDSEAAPLWPQVDVPCDVGTVDDHQDMHIMTRDPAEVPGVEHHMERRPDPNSPREPEGRPHASRESSPVQSEDTSVGEVFVRSHYRSLPGGRGLSTVSEDIERRVSLRRSSGGGGADSRDSGARGVKDDDGRIKRAEGPADAGDEVMAPKVIDYERRTERRRDRCAREIDGIEREERLRNAAIAADMYSFGWFCALIELESLYGSAGSGRDEVTLTFSRVSREEGTERTLVLEQPDRAIPASVEDLSNIPLALTLPDHVVRVEIEVASVRNLTLRARLKDGSGVSGIDLSRVEEARIEVRSPAFLMEELRKRYVELGLERDFNMRDNLPSNIEFVFGPPGTGKTTHVARVLDGWMRGTEDLRVLVLTPTNKAADVLSKKVLECAGGADSCVDWLVRFGLTEDAELQDAGIYRDKTFDVTALPSSVTITTVARFPYDYLMRERGHLPLRDIEWDYVVFDEASMISCAQITYPLYMAHPRTFVVAGDPHQIAPVIKVDLWEGENVYTMVGLESFRNPRTVPHDYKVTTLTTQYRSVPAIGSVFSEFSYDGLLASHRDGAGVDRSYLGPCLEDHPVNVIHYPVRPYESVYRPKRLGHGSSYQPYAALLTYELVGDIARRAGRMRNGKGLSIGVVSPYRAQADLMAGLLARLELPDGVSVQAGTVHGFQGDECDVMVVVLNTPPTISSGKGMFLNRRNILNVSVSRAADSLVLLVPDKDTRAIDQLIEVLRLELHCLKSEDAGLHSAAMIEQELFGSPTFIEDHCFSCGHQSVNVYGRPEQRYEIRSAGQAIDIQILATQTPSEEAVRPRKQEKAGRAGGKAAEKRHAPSPSKRYSPPTPVQVPAAGASKSPVSRPWSQDELIRLRQSYRMYMMQPHSLCEAIGGRSILEIDAKALQLGLVSKAPVRKVEHTPKPKKKRKGGPSPQDNAWRPEEDMVLLRNYPRFGLNTARWDERLEGRSTLSIKKRARKLGL